MATAFARTAGTGTRRSALTGTGKRAGAYDGSLCIFAFTLRTVGLRIACEIEHLKLCKAVLTLISIKRHGLVLSKELKGRIDRPII